MNDTELFLPVARAVIPKGKPPDPERLDPSPFVLRRPFSHSSPFAVNADTWRNIVGKSPIASLCRRTLILEITAVPWKVLSEDEEDVGYYTDLLRSANGESFEVFIERLVEDVLTVPFGGAVEVSRYRDGMLAMIYHVDGGTLFPTYDPKIPYLQVDPENQLSQVGFTRNQLARVMWAPNPDKRNYGWSKTPAMDIFSAIEHLMRSETFYQQFLSNTPEAGILDLMDMEKKAAKEWVQSWAELMGGIDPLKVPVLYEHEKQAKFIPFSRPPSELALPEVVKRYSEQVCAAFGMTITDLGIFEHANTLAGASRAVQLSKRQGQGSLMRKVSNLINSMLPDTVAFEWEPFDSEDKLRRAQTQSARATTLKALGTPDPSSGEAFFPAEIIRKQAVSDGLVDVLSLEGLAEFEEEMQKKKEEEEAAEAANTEAGLEEGTPGSEETNEPGLLSEEDVLRNNVKGGEYSLPFPGGPRLRERNAQGVHNQKSHGSGVNAPGASANTVAGSPATGNKETGKPLSAGMYNKARDDALDGPNSTVTLEEHSAMVSYVEDWQAINETPFNKKIRDGMPLSASEEAKMQGLDSVTDKGTLPRDTTLYRGVQENFWGQEIGGTFTDAGFVSTSARYSSAHKFGPTVIEINAPASTRGMYMRGVSKAGEEFEYLLPRGATFKITGFKYPASGRQTDNMTVTVDIVPSS